MNNGKMQERIVRLMHGGSPRWIRVYDNGGETVDRFTVLFTGRIAGKAPGWNFYLGMSKNPYHPQGFGQHGEYQGQPYDVNRHGFAPAIGRKCHLGRRIRFDVLPEPCRRLVVDDYAEYWRLDKQAAFKAAGLE